MLTIKLRNKNSEELKATLLPYTEASTYSFRDMFQFYENKKHDHETEKKFEEKIREEFPTFSSYFYQSMKKEIEGNLSSREEKMEEDHEKLMTLYEDILEVKGKKKSKLQRKIQRIETKKYYTEFGGKSLRVEIDRLKTKIDSGKGSKKDIKRLEKKIKEYKEKRIVPIIVYGEEYHNGNRHFDFDFKNNRLFFKPNSKTRIEINFKTNKNDLNTLLAIQETLDSKKYQAITVKLTATETIITYDETILSGNKFPTKELKKARKGITKEENPDLYKKIGQKFAIQHSEYLLMGKIAHRFMCTDLNPDYIGLCVIDYIDGEFKIVFMWCFDLSHLSKRLNRKSSSMEQLHLNNKRKHEIKEIWKNIFFIATYFKVGYFIHEKLKFSKKDVGSKEANRKILGLWHRTLTSRLILKHTSILGIQIREVSPYMTSFLGNILHPEIYDPIAASIEIGKRGIEQYIKGHKFLPDITSENITRMKILLEDQIKDKSKLESIDYSTMGWKDWYNLFRDEKIQWRNKEKPKENMGSFKTYKSKIKILKVVVPIHEIKSKSSVSCRKLSELNEGTQIDHKIKPVISNPSHSINLRGSRIAVKDSNSDVKLPKISKSFSC